MASAGTVFDVIRAAGDATRGDVATATGLSRSAVATRVDALTRLGLVVERETAASTGGRPASLLRFDAHAGVVASVAVGISRTRLAICTLDGAVLCTADVEQELALGPDDLLPGVVDRLGALLDQCADVPVSVPVYGLGLSLPGTVDRAAGCSRNSPILPGWDGIDLRRYFRAVASLSDVPIVVDNDANAIAVAERGGTMRGLDDLLVIKASTGLGAGIVAGGRLQRGAGQAAGEIGHDKTPAARGRACRCGDTGCLETVAAGWAIVEEMRSLGSPVRHLRDVVAAARACDPVARRMVRDSGRHVGEVIAAAVNLLNPAALVIAGDMTGAYDDFVAGLRESLYGKAMAAATRELRIVPAAHGDASAVIGSAVLALDEVLCAAAVDRMLARGAVPAGR